LDRQIDYFKQIHEHDKENTERKKTVTDAAVLN